MIRIVTLIVAITSVLPALGVSKAQVEADSLFAYGKQLHYDGRYDSAIQVYQQVRLQFEQAGNIDKLIEALYELGESFLNIGKCDSAMNYISKGLELSGEDQEQLANGYYTLARAQGGCANNWAQSITTLRKSMRIKQVLFGAKSNEISFDYSLMGYLSNSSGNYDTALHYLNKALEIRSDNPEMDPVELSATYFYLTKTYERKGDFMEALKYGHLALEIRQKHLIPVHPSTSNCLSNLGNIYKRMGNFDRSVSYLLQALEIRKETLGEDHVNVGASYYGIGTLYGNMFDYRRAIPYIEQGNLILRNKLGEEIPVLHTYYAYLGRLYYLTGHPKKGMELMIRSENLAETHIREDHIYRAIIYDIIGKSYARSNQLALQEKYHKKALQIYVQQGKRTTSEANVLVNLGEACFKRSDLDGAKEYYDKALLIYQERLGAKSPSGATLYRNLGDIHWKRKDYQSAMEEYWRSINALSYDSVDASAELDLRSITHKQNALKSLHKIAITLASLYDETGDVSYLKQSMMEYQRALELIGLVTSGFKLEDSKAQLASDTRSVFSDAVKTAYQLYQITGEDQFKSVAYEIIERSKSPILLAKVQEIQATTIGNIPDSVISKERDLRIELSYYKEQFRDASASEDESRISHYQNEIFEAQNRYENLKEDLKRRFPEYYDYRYVNDVTKWSSVSDLLPKGTAIIEYFEAKDALYTIILTADAFEMIDMPLDSRVEELLNAYQLSLTDNIFLVKEPKTTDSLFTTSAYQLYQRLVAPALAQLEDPPKKLIVIPDGRLSRLNFGTLLSKPSKPAGFRYSELNYLLSDCSISYAYSATLNFRSVAKSRGSGFAGFAPSYKPSEYANLDSSEHPMVYELVRDGKLPLPGAIMEVQEISEFLNGDTWIKEHASESNFKKHAQRFSIIHLAMHSLLNNEDPEYSELLFNNEQDSLNDGYLTIDEIYNLSLQANMVVLSACSSGRGTLQVGEGPISFTRAFSYAGCPSVIMSMWKLPDDATSQIMVEFYQNINAGDAKDDALRKAQLSYLSSTDDPLYQHPFFWGSFVAMGDANPIEKEPAFNLALILALFAVALALIPVFAKKKKVG